MNLLRRLLLGSDRFPADVRAQLQAEGPHVIEEGLGGSVTYRNYRAPGKRFSLRKVALAGAIAVTDRRLVIYARGRPWVDLPLDDPRLGTFTIGLDKPDRLRLAFEAGTFHADRSGTVELRLTTSQAGRVVELLEQRLRGRPPASR